MSSLSPDGNAETDQLDNPDTRWYSVIVGVRTIGISDRERVSMSTGITNGG
jgi:hypothetical protein